MIRKIKAALKMAGWGFLCLISLSLWPFAKRKFRAARAAWRRLSAPRPNTVHTNNVRANLENLMNDLDFLQVTKEEISKVNQQFRSQKLPVFLKEIAQNNQSARVILAQLWAEVDYLSAKRHAQRMWFWSHESIPPSWRIFAVLQNPSGWEWLKKQPQPVILGILQTFNEGSFQFKELLALQIAPPGILLGQLIDLLSENFSALDPSAVFNLFRPYLKHAKSMGRYIEEEFREPIKHLLRHLAYTLSLTDFSRLKHDLISYFQQIGHDDLYEILFDENSFIPIACNFVMSGLIRVESLANFLEEHPNRCSELLQTLGENPANDPILANQLIEEIGKRPLLKNIQGVPKHAVGDEPNLDEDLPGSPAQSEQKILDRSISHTSENGENDHSTGAVDTEIKNPPQKTVLLNWQEDEAALHDLINRAQSCFAKDTASQEKIRAEIHEWYKKLALKFHPDKHSGLDDKKKDAEAIFKAAMALLQSAKEALDDPHSSTTDDLDDFFDFFFEAMAREREELKQINQLLSGQIEEQKKDLIQYKTRVFEQKRFLSTLKSTKNDRTSHITQDLGTGSSKQKNKSRWPYRSTSF